ncbi:MAG TPA: 2-oxo acid dehydrogenase subunit E2, partial [Steroidobacteraceae bacterium]|nr:2-oxo acid dehydrogenase subunit E2 [Steroidobacteraceae bacterium]
MSIEVRVPQLPESIADATLVSWHKKIGEAVNRDENLVDLETDKVVLEVPAPSKGVIKELKVANGATVTSGQVLAILEEGAAAVAKPVAAASVVKSDADKSGPAARRMIDENKLTAAQIAATGKDGRVTKADVIQHMAKPAANAPTTQSIAQSAAKPAVKPAPAMLAPAGARTEQRVPMTRLRARVAERLVQAQATAAMLTTFNEVDLTAVNEIRARYKEKFEKTHGAKLGFMSFFVKASIEALRRFPAVNASLDGGDIVYHEYYDIGVAVSTDRGLMVPVLRNAESLRFAQIESSVASAATRARDGSITLEELSGGTFTIS